MNETNTTPKWFTVIAVIAMIWNLLGLMAFAMQMMMAPEALTALPQAEQDLYATQPGWLNIVFGGAVIAGVLGSLGLLLKKAWALPLFIVSLLCVLAQHYYMFFMSNMFEVIGQGAMVMPIVVLFIAIFLVWFASVGRNKGRLT